MNVSVGAIILSAAHTTRHVARLDQTCTFESQTRFKLGPIQERCNAERGKTKLTLWMQSGGDLDPFLV